VSKWLSSYSLSPGPCALAGSTPLAASGASTYRISVVVEQSSAPFAGIADFKGKRVAYCLLASAGEVFVHSCSDPGRSQRTSSARFPSIHTRLPSRP